VLYRRKSGNIAIALLALYLLIVFTIISIFSRGA
jgi:hypothetical protein